MNSPYAGVAGGATEEQSELAHSSNEMADPMEVFNSQFKCLTDKLFENLNANQIGLRESNNAAAYDYWKKAAAYNSREAQKQRDFEEYMSNTAVSRRVDDLKRSGFNPILSIIGGGMGAADGSSSSAASMSASSTSEAHSNETAEDMMAIIGLLGTAVSAISGFFKKK